MFFVIETKELGVKHMIYQELELFISKWKDEGSLLNETVKVTSVEVFEHAGNSAIYQA